MKKIGFVIPWYGENIPGGAEMELREVTGHLKNAGTAVEILTTCAKDFSSDWNKNFYRPGDDTVGGIPVKRFKLKKRDQHAFDLVNAKLMRNETVSPAEEKIFIDNMVGSDDLYEYIRKNSDDYTCFVFIPYMFGTTYFGAKACEEKAVFIPCFHDEAYAHMNIFREQYSKARGMIFNAMPEMKLAEELCDLSCTEEILMGIGMDTDISSDAERFRKKYKIDSPFILYAGRKDKGKNVDTLLKYFAEYRKRHETDLRLVLIGGGSIEIPESAAGYVDDLGFVDKSDKYDAAAAAEFLCQPSKNESFSLVIMESWLCGRPVLVHGKCPVTRNFASESNGGLYFENYFEFEGCVDYFLNNKEKSKIMGENGKKYVTDNFSWDIIVKKYISFFEKLEETEA